MSDISYPNDLSGTGLGLSGSNRSESSGSIPGQGEDQETGSSLLQNFGTASLLVVAGVVVSGFLLTSKQNAADSSLPALPVAAWQIEAAAGGNSESWIDLADRAFTSGRITDPLNDNALYYYHQAVLVNPEDEQAQQGLDKVVAYVISDAETAIYDSDWAQARREAEEVLAVLPGHEEAASVIARAEKFERIEELSQLAVNQLATDRLLSPRDDNALNSYRLIEDLDPGNAEAAVGVQSVAQRLVAKSQTAAIEGKFDQSARYMKQAKSIAPKLANLAQAAKLTDQFTKLTQEKAAEKQQLADAEETAAAQGPTGALASDASSEASAELPSAERIFNVSDLTVERSVAPVFPRRAGQAEKEGWVELNFRVDTKGDVFDAAVVRSSDREFESSALNAIRKWRFAPYSENGELIAVRSGVRFSFRQ